MRFISPLFYLNETDLFLVKINGLINDQGERADFVQNILNRTQLFIYCFIRAPQWI